MGYGATEGFALGCRGDGAAAGCPIGLQLSSKDLLSVGLSCGLKERIRDLASAVGERKEQSYSAYSKSWDGHAAIFIGPNYQGL